MISSTRFPHDRRVDPRMRRKRMMPSSIVVTPVLLIAILFETDSIRPSG